MHLEDLAHKLELELVYDILDDEEFIIKSGICHLNGKPLIIVDKRKSIEEKIRILVDILSNFNTDNIYILPEIRKLLKN